MKRLHLLLVIAAMLCCLLFGALLPVFAAEDGVPNNTADNAALPDSPLLITEVQTGLATAGDEFVELYNPGKIAVDLTGWQIRYQNATAASSSLVATIGDAQAQPVVPAGGYFVLHTASVILPVGTMGQIIQPKLSAADKTVGLFAPDESICELHVQDALAWGTSLFGEGEPLTAPSVPGDALYYRLADSKGLYSVTHNSADDFGMITTDAAAPTVLPTPGAANGAIFDDTATASGTTSGLVDVKMLGCSLPEQQVPQPDPVISPVDTPTQPTPPPSVTQPAQSDGEAADPTPVMPARNNGLYAPQISELLPNPAKPQTDANDEFIELYNSNAVPFELSGFILESGMKTKKRYTFPQGTLLPAKSFTAFFSKDTTISLANTQGQVWLLDPLQRSIAQSEAYSTAKDGQSWLVADSTWQWSTEPTPSALNVLRTPAAKASKAAAKTSTAAQGTVKSAASPRAAGTTTASTQSTAKAAADEGFNPLHPAILAITGVVAVSYGIYEYRRDLANKLHQFRANRAARAEARRSTARR